MPTILPPTEIMMQVIKGELRDYLWDRWNIYLQRLEYANSMSMFAIVVRGAITREPGQADLGGYKYWAVYYDRGMEMTFHDLSQRYKWVTKTGHNIWWAFKVDQINKMWGVK